MGSPTSVAAPLSQIGGLFPKPEPWAVPANQMSSGTRAVPSGLPSWVGRKRGSALLCAPGAAPHLAGKGGAWTGDSPLRMSPVFCPEINKATLEDMSSAPLGILLI